MRQLRNKVQLIGNLGSDPEVKEVSTGTKLARWSIATNESYKTSEGESVTETQWHNIIAWGKLAEIAEKYLQKGQEVCIEGKLTNREYDDDKGVKRKISEVVVNDILLLGKKN